jgi:hypothetical protein
MQSSRSYNPFGSRYSSNHVCGCYYLNTAAYERIYLPQVKLDVQTTILSTASRTVLRQTFVNYSTYPSLDEIRYIQLPFLRVVSLIVYTQIRLSTVRRRQCCRVLMPDRRTHHLRFSQGEKRSPKDV